jgi:hypothetical protein
MKYQLFEKDATNNQIGLKLNRYTIEPLVSFCYYGLGTFHDGFNITEHGKNFSIGSGTSSIWDKNVCNMFLYDYSINPNFNHNTYKLKYYHDLENDGFSILGTFNSNQCLYTFL